MNSRSFRSSNHHLLSEARYRKRVAPLAVAIALTVGRPGLGLDRPDVDPEEAPGEDDPEGGHGDAGQDQAAVDPEQGERLLGLAAGPTAGAKTGSSQPCSRLAPNGRPRNRPSRIVGIASRISGTVIQRPDSWISGSTAGSTRLSPQKVRPDQPEHVEGGHPGDQEADRPDPQEAVLERVAQDLVLAEEAGQRRDARDRDRADQHRPVGDRDLLRQAAHLAHVLLVVDGVDHRARIEEQQALEEAVGHQVEDRRGPRPDAQGGEHVAELGQRRVGQDPLDVGLGEGDRGGQDRREGADRGDHDHDLRARGRRSGWSGRRGRRRR